MIRLGIRQYGTGGEKLTVSGGRSALGGACSEGIRSASLADVIRELSGVKRSCPSVERISWEMVHNSDPGSLFARIV